MKFIYQGEKPCVILFGDACDMGAYCTDLNYFDIKPELIITDAESFDDTWRGIPVRPFATIREYVGISNMVIVPINRWPRSTMHKLAELDGRLPNAVVRDIELLLRLSIGSKVEGLPTDTACQSDKILLSLQLGFVLGGLEAWVTNLYRQMKLKGYPVMIVEPLQKSEYKYVGAEFYHVAPEDMLSMGAYDSFMPYVERMIELMANNPPKVYVDNGSYRLMAAISIVKTQLHLPIKVVSVMHGDMDIVYNRVMLCESVIDKFVAVSDPIRESLSKKLPNRAEDISVQMQLPSAHPESLKARTQSGKLRIAYAARLEASNKRSMWLINIMDGLTAQNVSFEMSIAGDGECYEPIKVHIAENHLENCVHMCGKIPHEEMDDFWRDKHVFINFSVSEGGPLTLFESMSHGLVPVVTNAGSASRLVFADKSGYIIDSPQTAVDALTELAGDMSRCERLQQGAMDAFLALQRDMGDPVESFI